MTYTVSFLPSARKALESLQKKVRNVSVAVLTLWPRIPAPVE